MNKFQPVLRAFIEAQQTKEETKTRWRQATVGQDGYDKVRMDFLNADAVAEAQFADVAALLMEARQEGELVELLAELPPEESELLRSVMLERGAQSLLSDQPKGFEELLHQARRTAAFWTALRQVKYRRYHCIETGEFIPEDCPANLPPEAWNKANLAIKKRIAELRAEQTETSLEEATKDASDELEHKARLSYDRASASLVAFVQKLIENGTLEWELSELKDPALMRIARDFISRVPLPQRHIQPRLDRR